MFDLYDFKTVLRSPVLGLIPLFLFSVLLDFTGFVAAAGVALLLSLLGSLLAKRCCRLLYHISTLTFIILLILLPTNLRESSVMSSFVPVEVMFLLLLMLSRLLRGKILIFAAKERSRIEINWLKESFRIAFRTEYYIAFHLLVILLCFTIGGEIGASGVRLFLLLLQALPVIIILPELVRLHLVVQKLSREEWLPVVTESGEVKGRVAKSVTKDMKNRFMHPVVRVALMNGASIYLNERDETRLLNPGRLDHPFEKYMQFNDDIDETVRESVRKECGNENIPLRFMLKYVFENEVTKRLVFLYVVNIDDDNLFNSLNLQGGKLWTAAQIEDNLGSDIFSNCFELEYEYLKNTLLLAQKFKK